MSLGRDGLWGTGLPVCTDGVILLSDHTGRRTGEAFVFFVDKESSENALGKDREKIGHRWGGTKQYKTFKIHLRAIYVLFSFLCYDLNVFFLFCTRENIGVVTIDFFFHTSVTSEHSILSVETC